MEISRIQGNTSFGRALTTRENEQRKVLMSQARNDLKLGRTMTTVFDFNIPSQQGYDTGIGTTLSDKSQEVMQFIQDASASNAMLLGPQGQVSSFNTSPYSGTNFSLGEHLIDLKKLTTEKYGNLLDEKYVKSLDSKYPRNKSLREVKVDYKYILGDDKESGIQDKALQKAFKSFKKLPANSDMKKEFEIFKKDNNFWLEKDSVYEALAQEYGVHDSSKWREKDRELYSGRYDKYEIEDRVDEIKEKYADLIDYKQFVQFIIDKEQQEAKAEYNAKGFKAYGDCLIGFSDKEFWANKECFKDGKYMGCKDDRLDSGVQTWGFPAPDYNKLGTPEKPGPLGEFLLHKYDMFFKRYDGARIDAAWQLITPFVYTNESGKPVPVEGQPNLGNKVLKFMETSAKNAGKLDKDSLLLELLGVSANEGVKLTKNKYPHIHITRYQHNTWGHPGYYEKKGSDLFQNYNRGDYTIGIGTHDDETLVEQSRNANLRKEQSAPLAKELKLNENELANNEVKFREAKAAQLFTTQNQFFTLPDFFGMDNRINNPKLQGDMNWSNRIPQNYEDFYHKQLQKKLAINFADSYAKAIEAQNINSKALDGLKKLAAVLSAPGPTTQAEADKKYGANFSSLS